MKSPEKLTRQMARRGWTPEQVGDAIATGERHRAINLETGAAASRYVHPETGRSVVIDDVSGEIIHVGGDGFVY